ncbi:MAG: small subunit ribosomal protein [Actinomycetota bacterium]|nr:small subunit ribosomal protein [Actinomycetota bacterium]MDQ1539637.1 small subunit ribosomal protein [Actinomycetota bacterium]
MAVKIKLMRLGKMRAPYYRIVVADSRTKRDGRAIEEIGKYHPKQDPSFIEVNGERAAYWLSVGAQPTEAVTAIFKVSGDWQKFKGLPAPPPMLVAAVKADKRIAFEAAAKEGSGEPTTAATTPRARKAPAKKTADPSSPESSDAAAVAVEAAEADGGIEAITAVESGGGDAPRAEASIAEEVADAATPDEAPSQTEAAATEAPAEGTAASTDEQA